MKFSELLGNTNEETQEGKATDLLKQDHDEVRELFGRYRGLMEDEGNDREKQRLFAEIDRDLTAHSKVEEEIFYPAVRRTPDEEATDLVLEANEEHGIVKLLLAQLRGLSPRNETFDPKMKVLMESVEHHADEEENEMFPHAEELGDEALERMGRKIAQRKQQILAEGAPKKGRRPAATGATAARRRTARSAGATKSARGSRTRTTRRGGATAKRGGSARSASAASRKRTSTSSGKRRASR